MQTRILRGGDDPDAVAPDGSQVRVLCVGDGGSMAHFRLPAGEVSVAVAHRTVEELWYVVAGRGSMWRRLGTDERIETLEPGVSVHLPVGVEFQFRAEAEGPLEAVAVTMPPWPGDGEARPVTGPWPPSAAPGRS